MLQEKHFIRLLYCFTVSSFRLLTLIYFKEKQERENLIDEK